MAALPSPDSSRVREPLCADDGASVDARFILSTVIILSLSHPGGYYCMFWRSRRELWITIGVARGQVPLCPCGGRNCGVDLSVENVDRPRPDQQRRSVLPAGFPARAAPGTHAEHAAIRLSAVGLRQDTILVCLTPRPSDTAHCARLVTRSLVRSGRRPRHLGAASVCSFPAPFRTNIAPWRAWIWR